MSRDSSEVERHDRSVEGLRCNSTVSAPILSGHQPVYLPSILLFNKIALSDAFMWCGHCQLQNKSWHTRNFVRGKYDSIMLSVPVVRDFGQSINDTILDPSEFWRRKHCRSIAQNYAKRPYFKEYFPAIEQLIMWRKWSSLGELNKAITETMLDWFEIETLVIDGCDYQIEGQKNDMLISMCDQARYSHYLSNEGAHSYVDEYYLKDHDVTHHWQKFTHPTYEQGHRDFITNLSAIDILFNLGGPEAGRIIRASGYVD